ncbi:MAG TPA: Hsp20/alpha crystallin family protein [Chitinophagaceae bacterium]
MSLIRRNELFPRMTGLFDDLFANDGRNWGVNNFSATNTTLPAVNIKETGEAFVVEMAAPGMNKNDFRIELDGNQLTISSEKQSRDEGQDGDRYTRCEFSYQSFQRVFQLPRDVVDADKIGAKYENGVLRLLIPKKEEAKQRPPKTIQVA